MLLQIFMTVSGSERFLTGTALPFYIYIYSTPYYQVRHFCQVPASDNLPLTITKTLS